MAARLGLASLFAAAAAAAGASAPVGPRDAALQADTEACGAGASCPAVSALQHEAARHRRFAGQAAVGGGVVGRAEPLKKLVERLAGLVRMIAIRDAIKKHEDASETDPFWAATAAEVKNMTYNFDPDSKEWMDYCQAGEYDKFNAKSCSPKAGGSTMMHGVMADAWYCGRTEGMDWGEAGKPTADLCKAPVGSAYRQGGICAIGDKQLLLNFIYRGPMQWSDPHNINVPSIDCIMGIVDCDIYYCQHCPGHCRDD